MVVVGLQKKGWKAETPVGAITGGSLRDSHRTGTEIGCWLLCFSLLPNTSDPIFGWGGGNIYLYVIIFQECGRHELLCLPNIRAAYCWKENPDSLWGLPLPPLQVMCSHAADLSYQQQVAWA